jgi:selenocysteine lyase/cysteine desulfurase
MLRRDFLVRTGLTIGAAAFARAEAAAKSCPSIVSPDDWEGVRAEFVLEPGLAHLAGFYLASHPRPVREAIDRHRQALDANPFEYHHHRAAEHEARVLLAAARYLGVAPTEIALTDSTTMGLGLLYGGLKLRPGQEILQTTHDHYATNASIGMRAERTGTTVRRIPLYRNGAGASADEVVSSLRAGITDKTAAVAVTWVHSSTGVKLPIRAMADVIAGVNSVRDESDRILFCVDGVHGIGIEDVRLPDLGCDFFIAGCHKWLLGPRGTGLVWGRADAWERVSPTIPPFGFVRRDPKAVESLGVDPDSEKNNGIEMTPGGFHSFEHRWALSEAFAFHERLGKSRVAERIHRLNSGLKEGLSTVRHVKLHTPKSDALSAGIVCFEVAGMSPDRVVERLREKNVLASVTPYEVEYARLAAGLINSEADVEAAIRTVAELG